LRDENSTPKGTRADGNQRIKTGRYKQFAVRNDKLLTSGSAKLPLLAAGLFDEYHSFSARCSFDDGLYRRLDRLPGGDPLPAAPTRLIRLRNRVRI